MSNMTVTEAFSDIGSTPPPPPPNVQDADYDAKGKVGIHVDALFPEHGLHSI